MSYIEIDARTKHKPSSAAILIKAAIKNPAIGSRAEAARRCGVSDEYLRLLLKGEREMSYGLQVLLEGLAH